MKPPVRPPRLRCGLFPSIYLSHLLVLPATFGLQRFLPPYPYFPALYVVSVRQVRGLPTASSRFHLTMDTLAVQLCASSLPTRTRDFHPLEPAHGGRTRQTRSPNRTPDLHLPSLYHSLRKLQLLFTATVPTGLWPGRKAHPLQNHFFSANSRIFPPSLTPLR